MDDLPSEFDVIVIGTGLAESVVSAAVARNGHSVLHIDPRDYYGGKWATLAWDAWTSGSFSKKPQLLETKEGNVVGTFEGITGDKNSIVWTNDVRELEELWYSQEKSIMDEVTFLTRKFNIDISPKVLMAREETIQLLIQSNVSRYLEFSCIKKLMSSLPAPNDTIIESIPLCRSDIFTTKTISLIEKRKFMKFIEFVLQSNSGAHSTSSEDADESQEAFSPSSSKSATRPGFGSKTFEELAKLHHLTPKIKHLIQSAVRTMDDCMQICSDEIEDGEDNFNIKFTENCRLFLQSINRYGNQTPFLWTLYGISEICQAFCRLSAIYGGIFILKRSIESISEDKEDPDHITINSEGSELKAKYVILGPELKIFNGRKIKSPKCRHGITLVRGVLLVTGPRLKAEITSPSNSGNGPGQLTVYRLGDMDVMELDDSSVAAPKNYRLLHVTTPYRSYEGSPTPKQIVEGRLAPFVQFENPPPSTQLAESDKDEEMETDEIHEASRVEERPVAPTVSPSPTLTKPLVLHGSYFLLDFYEDIKDEDCESPRILSCATSSSELSNHVQKARDIFHQMFPTEEFLPKAPDAPEPDFDDEYEPEDNINGEDENNEVAQVQPAPIVEDIIPDPVPAPVNLIVGPIMMNGYHFEGNQNIENPDELPDYEMNGHGPALHMNGNNDIA